MLQIKNYLMDSLKCLVRFQKSYHNLEHIYKHFSLNDIKIFVLTFFCYIKILNPGYSPDRGLKGIYYLQIKELDIKHNLKGRKINIEKLNTSVKSK